MVSLEGMLLLRQRLLVVLPIMGLVGGAAVSAEHHNHHPVAINVESTTITASSSSLYRVRPQFSLSSSATTTATTNQRRHLFEFIPTFSEDGTDAELPLLSIQLLATNMTTDGTTTMLSEDAYDAIQIAMNEYITEALGNTRWSSTNSINPTTPIMSGVRSEIIAERILYMVPDRRQRSLLRNIGGGSISSSRSSSRRTLQDSGDGVEIDLKATLTFRDGKADEDGTTTEVEASENEIGTGDIEFNNDGDSVESSTASSTSTLSVPSQQELEAAAGDIWNDLSTFENVYLADVLAREENEALRQEFVNIESMASATVFPTSAPSSTAAATNAPVSLTAPTEAPSTITAPETTSTPTIGDMIAGINEAEAPPVQRDGINPLWPALIVGIAVFLFTIILLGYRRQRYLDDLIGNKADDMSLHIHDSMTLSGDEEIEIEDPVYQPDAMDEVGDGTDRGIVSNRNIPTSGGGATFEASDAAVPSSNNNNYNILTHSVPYPFSTLKGRTYDVSLKGGNDGPNATRSSTTYGRTDMTGSVFSSNRTSSGGLIKSPRSSMHNHRRGQSKHDEPPPTHVLEIPPTEEDYDTYATMDSSEKRTFLRLIKSGMSVPDASEHILKERQLRYSAKTDDGGRSSSTHSGVIRSLSGRMSSSAKQTLQSEIMEDGKTTVHVPQHLTDSSAQYIPCMMMSEASSVASSFDDREYLQIDHDGAATSAALNVSGTSSRKGIDGSIRRNGKESRNSSFSSCHSGGFT
jgi:hypothetical protein